MRGLRGGGVSVPALLVVVSFTGCVAREDPYSDTGDSDDTTPDPTTTTTTTDAESSTTPSPETSSESDTATTESDADTTESTSSSDDTTTSGPVELPDCASIGFVAECEDEDYCTWEMEVGCIVDCVQRT